MRMRDGVVLRADVWRPSSAGRFPVLVYRTPYDRRHAQGDASTVARAAARGYAVVVQDVRGRYGSDGEFDPYRNEGRDGFDTIEWAAAQPWSDGSVGTFGLSYPGAVQWLAAVESPPHLKAMVAGHDVLHAAQLLLCRRHVRHVVAALDLEQHRARRARAPQPGRTAHGRGGARGVGAHARARPAAPSPAGARRVPRRGALPVRVAAPPAGRSLVGLGGDPRTLRPRRTPRC